MCQLAALLECPGAGCKDGPTALASSWALLHHCSGRWRPLPSKRGTTWQPAACNRTCASLVPTCVLQPKMTEHASMGVKQMPAPSSSIA